ncbi:aldehyde dehydrogenase [Sphingobium sp. AN641]|uniref:aldehyde dehydrogenase n=1 Tax=Sphingobium sp. AN641 TaxID=3133443 RepID=UPI0030C258F1
MANSLGYGIIRNPDQFFIGGRWVKPSSDAMLDVIAPATETVFLSVAEGKESDIDHAVAAARHAFDNGPWPRLAHAQRAEYLRALSAKLSERAGDIAQAWPSEMGVILPVAQGTASFLPSIYEYYAGLADIFPFEERRVASTGGTGLLIREPVGVVGIIIPWNAAPFLLAFKLAPALLAGCTVVIKPSPEAPVASYIMAEIAEAIGLPPGVINVVTADRQASESLVRDPRVDKISFTGSSAVGRRIASICGERLARYTLELGGKSPALLFDDYDVEAAAACISQSTRVMTGQVCAALTRVIVEESRHDAFVEALSASFKTIRIGDPYDPQSDMGPLAMARQRDRVEEYIAKGVAQGAQLATGGGRPAYLNRGFYIEPTVFGRVDNRSVIAQEEIFGPVICVIPAKGDDEMVKIANDSPFGLNASVFTNDHGRALAVSRRLQSGSVGHNGFHVDPTLGFGGFKQSGVGREGGIEGLLPYLESKAVVMDDAIASTTKPHAAGVL